MFGNIKCSDFVLTMFEKVGTENDADPFNNILKILDMGLSSSWKHDMKCWQCGIFFFETLRTGNFETQLANTTKQKNKKPNTKKPFFIFK